MGDSILLILFLLVIIIKIWTEIEIEGFIVYGRVTKGFKEQTEAYVRVVVAAGLTWLCFLLNGRIFYSVFPCTYGWR